MNNHQAIDDLLLLESADKIKEAVSETSRLGSILATTCKHIEALEGFQFANIQLIRPEERVIETVYGTGIGATWSGRARHYLEPDENLRDIQADIALANPPRSEIIAGWDSRFDRWVYEHYNHNRLVRVFAPIVLVRDEQGLVIDNWTDHCKWKILHQDTRVRRVKGIEMDLSGLDDGGQRSLEVIGTVEAGYEFSDRIISYQTAEDVTKLAAKKALEIHKAQIPYLLQTITECARRLMKADAASLHFMYDPTQERFVYNVCSGRIGRQYLERHPPRVNGLGSQAIEAGAPRFIPDAAAEYGASELKSFNAEAFAQGIRSMAAFPLLIDPQYGQVPVRNQEPTLQRSRSKGVLYVGFQREHKFIKSERKLINRFVKNQAVDAIQDVSLTTQMRDRLNQMAVLQLTEWSLVSEAEGEDLLRQIAWNCLNLLAADVVVIYEYYEDNSGKAQFLPPDIAGKLLSNPENIAQVEMDDPTLMALVLSNENVYANESLGNDILNTQRGNLETRENPFVVREKIKSSAGILIKVKKEIVGLMFIHYRRPHSFSDEEKNLIDTFASSAAIAIRNRRVLESINTVDREIITTEDLDKVLGVVLAQAIKITGANRGTIYRLDPLSRNLVIQTVYPQHESFVGSILTSLADKGTPGRVAHQGQTALVTDVQANPWFKSCFDNVRAELCVPLFDKTRSVLGVLDVLSDGTVFNARDQRILEALADQVVMAMQIAKNQEERLKQEKFVVLGDFASNLLHDLAGKLAGIRVKVQDIRDYENIKDINAMAGYIQTAVEEVLDEVQCICGGWKLEKEETPINLRPIIIESLNAVSTAPDLSITVDIPESLPAVTGGEQQLTKVFTNLIQNAVEAMPDGGVLSLTTKNMKIGGQQWIAVRVHDTGPGIPEHNIKLIFDLGFSTKQNRRKKGFGFGLWWTQAYVERIGGKVTVERVDNETIFTVALKASESKAT